eukprot:NODE_675_length_5306_cov_0.405224.p4 type:complete len:258 gc:universal NODE_675_length_5306_cov_0.405224:2198-1425(-)
MKKPVGNVSSSVKVLQYRNINQKMEIIEEEYLKVTNAESRKKFMLWMISFTNRLNIRIEENYQQPIDSLRIEGNKEPFYVQLFYQTNNYPYPFRFVKVKLNMANPKRVDVRNYGINEYRRATKIDLGVESQEDYKINIDQVDKKLEYLHFLLLPMNKDHPAPSFNSFHDKLNRRYENYQWQYTGHVITTNGEKLKCQFINYTDMFPPLELTPNLIRESSPKKGLCMFVIYNSEKYNHKLYENLFAAENTPTFIRYKN